MAKIENSPFAVDERKRPGWIYIILYAKGLKVKNVGGFMSKTKVATNADVEKPEFHERSFLVRARGKGDLSGKIFQLHIKKLPYDITKEDSYIEQTEENRILIFLKKSDSEQSWRTFIEGEGIETADDE